MPNFITDVEDIRARAAQKIEEGAVTDSYEGDVDQTVSILNEALATEIVCVLRYMHHYFMATGVHAMSVRDEFKEHADAEREHADKIAERIQELGGKPDFNPASLLQRSASQYQEGKSLSDMIKEDLIAERIVIEVYQKMIRHFGDKDPTTRLMIEHILRDEEEHASDLADLLFITDPSTGKTEGPDPGTHPLDMHRDEVSRQQVQGKAPKGDKSGQPAKRSVGAAAAGSAPNTQNDAGDETVDDDPELHGHPMNRRKKGIDGELDTGNPGSMSGTNRSVKVTNKTRKKRIA